MAAGFTKLATTTAAQKDTVGTTEFIEWNQTITVLWSFVKHD